MPFGVLDTETKKYAAMCVKESWNEIQGSGTEEIY
jgi:hypothetical protein